DGCNASSPASMSTANDARRFDAWVIGWQRGQVTSDTSGRIIVNHYDWSHFPVKFRQGFRWCLYPTCSASPMPHWPPALKKRLRRRTYCSSLSLTARHVVGLSVLRVTISPKLGKTVQQAAKGKLSATKWTHAGYASTGL